MAGARRVRGGVAGFVAWFAIVFAISGVLLVAAWESHRFLQTAERTGGHVVDSRTETTRDEDGSTRTTTILTVRYEVDGAQYTLEQSGSVPDDGRVEVLYQPGDPEDAAIEYGPGLAVGLAVAAALTLTIFGGMGAWGLRSLLRAGREPDISARHLLQATGRAVAGPASVEHVRWPGGEAWHVVVDAVVPDSGQRRRFHSDPLSHDPHAELPDEVTVYVDPSSPGRYWVDTSALEANGGHGPGSNRLAS